MCELFAMAGRHPTDVRASLEAFARRGGQDGRQKDGWGLAYYVDRDVRLIKEPSPAADSACVRFLQEHPFASDLVVAHIRKATRGSLGMSNCQPFVRELGGRMHVFAHNGDLDPALLAARFPLRRFRPVGETDSEYAFCMLLDRFAQAASGSAMPALGERRTIVERFASDLRELGPANFIYVDGEVLFAHGHRRFHGDGSGIRPPGLHMLRRRCPAPGGVDGAGEGEAQAIVLLASVPLTDEPGWRPLDEGELLIAKHGATIASEAALQ